MSRRPIELYLALVAVLVITAVYMPFAMRGVPRASGLAGHSLGIVGFLLMLSTETLYSLRKRARGSSLGRLRTWLQFHIFTGIVGPYLVLLHTAWQFNGLAGVVMLLSVIIVASGFVGRYIYTAVPRTADGAELAVHDLEAQIAAADAQLQSWMVNRPAAVGALAARLANPPRAPQSDWSLVRGRTLTSWSYQRQLQREINRLDQAGKAQAAELERLLNERHRLERQMRSLAAARKLLALWHTVHIPLGVTLFTLAFIHAGGALYYATLLR